MSYCIYLRKSRRDIEAEQQGAGETLARHRATLLELAKVRGLPIGHIYEEIVSGDSIDERPVMQKLLADVQAGKWMGVLVVEVERLARGDTIDQGVVAQAFKYSDTRIITPFRDYEPDNEADEEYFEFGLFMSRREYKTTKRRLQAGRIASVREGKYMGARAPYGYERVKLKGEKGWSLEVVPEKADIVRMCYDLYLHGRTIDGVHEQMGSQKIANLLNAMGLKTDLGNAWTAGYVRDMLKNPAYIGKVQWYQRETKVQIVDGKREKSRLPSEKHMLIDARHAPIIDIEQWDAVQTAFARYKKTPIKADVEIQNPLNSIVKCAVCGKAMVRTPMYGYMRGTDYLKCSTVGCVTASAPLEGVEQMILQALRDTITRITLSPPTRASQALDNTPLRESLFKQLEALEKRKTRLMELLENEVYDIATYTERFAGLAKEIAVTKAEMEKAKELVPDTEQAIADMLPAIETALDAYGTAQTAKAKNDILRSVLLEVKYLKPKRCYRGENPLKAVDIEIQLDLDR